jgi:nitrogen fixation protein FixH
MCKSGHQLNSCTNFGKFTQSKNPYLAALILAEVGIVDSADIVAYRLADRTDTPVDIDSGHFASKRPKK